MLVLLNNFIKFILSVILIIFVTSSVYSEEKKIDFIETNWSFNGIFGTFDRASLQRGYQVYQEVCAGCHSVQHLSYRNLFEEGGPEFSKEEAATLTALIGSTNLNNEQSQFIPESDGFHGSRALWTGQKGADEYWNAINSFLNKI